MKEFTIKMWVKILAWASASIIVFLNIQLVVDEILGWIGVGGEHKIIIYMIVIPFAVVWVALLVYIFIHPFLSYGLKKQPSLPHGQGVNLVDEESINYKNIAIAVDFSLRDQHIISSALKEGGKSATYMLIHVVESAAAQYLGESSLDYETKLDVAGLTKYQQSLEKSGYNVKIKICFGNAATEIIKTISDNQFDILVMGAHGHKGLKDIIFGTTVEKVRHAISIAVLIVK